MGVVKRQPKRNNKRSYLDVQIQVDPGMFVMDCRMENGEWMDRSSFLFLSGNCNQQYTEPIACIISPDRLRLTL